MEAVVALRRRLHQIAELSFVEVATTAVLLAELRPLVEGGARIRWGRDVLDSSDVPGYPDEDARRAAVEQAVAVGVPEVFATAIAEGGTGVVVDIDGSRPGRSIGMRFDIDGLPITEDTSSEHLPAREGFAATNGAMHACGHDGHAAIGVELARRLVADPDFAGSVRLIFQPAEESVRGGRAMLAAGVGEGLDVFVGLHLGENLPSRVLAASSHGLQATYKFQARFTGVAAHSANSPQDGRNALAAAAAATLNLLALPRDARAATNVNVGTIHGGRQSNIVPDEAVIGAEVRSPRGDVCDSLYTRALAVVAGAADMWGVSHEVVPGGSATSMDSDDVLVDHCLAAAASIAGVAELHRSVEMNASDDLSLWARDTQDRGGLATYLVVGGSSPAPHHHPRFDIAEDALPVALDWLEAIIRTMPADGPAGTR